MISEATYRKLPFASTPVQNPVQEKHLPDPKNYHPVSYRLASRATAYAATAGQGRNSRRVITVMTASIAEFGTRTLHLVRLRFHRLHLHCLPARRLPIHRTRRQALPLPCVLMRCMPTRTAQLIFSNMSARARRRIQAGSLRLFPMQRRCPLDAVTTRLQTTHTFTTPTFRLWNRA